MKVSKCSKKFFMLISLNGMLLSSFLRNKGEKVTDKGYIIEPLQGFRASANFRKETILYVDIKRLPKLPNSVRKRGLRNRRIWKNRPFPLLVRTFIRS